MLKAYLKKRRNFVSLIVILILAIALPVTFYLAQTQQIFQPRAATSSEISMGFMGATPNVVNPGQTVTIRGSATALQQQGLERVEIWGMRTTSQTIPTSDQFEQIGSYPCNDSSLCSFAISWVPDASDAGLWYVMADVYSSDGGVCSGWRNNPGADICQTASDTWVTVNGSTGGGNTSLNLRTVSVGSCSNNSVAVNLAWSSVTGAARYTLSRKQSGTAGTGQIMASFGPNDPLQFTDSSAPLNTTQEYTVFALNSSGTPIGNSSSVTVPIPACGTNVNNLSLVVSQIPTTAAPMCNNNQGSVLIDASHISGATYTYRRNNVQIFPTNQQSGGRHLANDINVPAGTYTYSVTATVSGGQTYQESKTVTVTCSSGGGTGQCAISGPSIGISGTLTGPFTVTGLPTGNYSCSWNIVSSNGTATPQFLNTNCTNPFNFTPNLSNLNTGTFTINVSVPITTGNTTQCQPKTITVTGNQTGGAMGYSCSNGCSAPVAGGTFSTQPQCQTSCGGGGGNPPPQGTCNPQLSCMFTDIFNPGASQCRAAGGTCAHFFAQCSCSGAQQPLTPPPPIVVPPAVVPPTVITPPAGSNPPSGPNPPLNSSATQYRLAVVSSNSSQTCQTALTADPIYFSIPPANPVELINITLPAGNGMKTACIQYYDASRNPVGSLIYSQIILNEPTTPNPPPTITPPPPIGGTTPPPPAGSNPPPAITPPAPGSCSVNIKANGSDGPIRINTNTGSYTLTWTSTGAVGQLISGGSWVGLNRSQSGTSTFNFTVVAGQVVTYNYTLTCTGANGQQNIDSVSVIVGNTSITPPPTGGLNPPPNITPPPLGNSCAANSTLCWKDGGQCSSEQNANSYCLRLHGNNSTCEISTSASSPTSGLFSDGCTRSSTAVTPPPPNLASYTKSYKIAETEAGLATAVEKPYTTHPTIASHDFSNTTPGLKQVWIEFIAADDTPQKPHRDRRTAQIELVVSDPSITGCSIENLGNGNIEFLIKGTNFGLTNGNIKSDQTALTISRWGDTEVRARWNSAPAGASFPVLLTRSDNRTVSGFCSGVSQLSLGARLFCRQPQKFDVTNVDVVLVEGITGGKKFKEVASIDKNGLVTGLKTQLEAGRGYKLSINAPKSVRRSVEFIAQSGTTVIGKMANNELKPLILPVGDIFPLGSEDGKINTADYAQMIREWVIDTDRPDRTADFNQDKRVNSVDWACMRNDFGAEDEPEPNPGPLSINASPSPSATTSPSKTATPSATTSGR